MAKLNMTVRFEKDNGSVLSTINSGVKATKSEAEAAIAAALEAQRAAAQSNAQDYVDAENAFNS